MMQGGRAAVESRREIRRIARLWENSIPQADTRRFKVLNL